MPDRSLCLILATALLAVGQLQTEAQAQASRGATGFAPRAEPVNPTAGAPMALPVMPMERPSDMVDPNRRLAQGDELSFQIVQDKEPAVPLLVNQAGEVLVEPLEHPLKVAGMNTTQAAAEIKRLLERDYYHTATVRLVLVRVNASAGMGYIYFSGEVARVGAVPIFANRPMKLSEAIIAAGGWGKFPDERRVNVRRPGSGGGTQTFVCDMKKVMKEGRMELDMLVQAGDQIYVPDTFFKK